MRARQAFIFGLFSGAIYILKAFTERSILAALNSFARCQDRYSSRKNHKTNRLYNPVLEILNRRWKFYRPELFTNVSENP